MTAPTLPLGDAVPISPAENASSGPHRGERQTGDTGTKGSTVVDTYPDILKHFHSVLHKTVGGALRCRETTSPCQCSGSAHTSWHWRLQSAKAEVQIGASSLLLLATPTASFK